MAGIIWPGCGILRGHALKSTCQPGHCGRASRRRRAHVMGELPLLILGAAVAGFVQGLSGFGFGLTAMSFWVWGLDPHLAAVMAVFGSLTGQVVAALTVRRAFDARALAPFIAGGLAGVPLGVWLLPLLDAQLFRFCVGLVLVVWCPLMLVSGRLPRVSGNRLGDALAGAAGGLMGGIGGFTGVIPTLWCTLRGMDKDAQRSVIQNFNLAMLAVAFAAHLGSGNVTRAMLPLLPVVAAALLVPGLIGARVYVGLSPDAFRRVVLGLLSLSGAAMLASSAPHLLARLLAG